MGIDVGFDLYPPLKHTDVDQWSRFLQAVCTEFASDAVVVVKDDEIEFQAGEHPTLYADPTRFRRFSSKVTGGGSIAVEPYIKQVYAIAKRYFGNRIFWWSEYCDMSNEKYTWSEVYDAARKPSNNN
jgi:hypothetical protein